MARITRSIRYHKWFKKIIKKWQRQHHGSRPNLDVIPRGYYCYAGKKKCPYYYTVGVPPDKRNTCVAIVAQGQNYYGGCKLIQLTDLDLKGFGLLWDQCKECGYKYE